jgi:hypothetical protein
MELVNFVKHKASDFESLWKPIIPSSTDNYEACIAAHYLARCHANPEKSLRWNQLALSHADLVNDERVRDFYPSLHLSLGRSYEVVGERSRHRDIMRSLPS